jgi:hypothetical protein
MTDHARLNADSTRLENQSGSITDGSQVIIRPEDNRVITNARSGDTRQSGGLSADSTTLEFGDTGKLFAPQSGAGKQERDSASFQDGISATESGASRTLKYDGANLLKLDAQTVENERAFGPTRFQLLNSEARYVKAGETMRFTTGDETANVSDTIKVDARKLNRDLSNEHMSQKTSDQVGQRLITRSRVATRHRRINLVKNLNVRRPRCDPRVKSTLSSPAIAFHGLRESILEPGMPLRSINTSRKWLA